MNRHPTAQMTIGFDDCDQPVDVIDALALASFITGEQPWSRTQRLARVRADAPLLPPGVVPGRVAADQNRRALLATGDGWTLRAIIWTDQSAQMTVTATDEALGRSVLDAAVDGAEEAPPEDDDDTVELGFWHRSSHGPHRYERRITAEPWSAIRRNYTRPAAVALDRLMAVTAERITGRLILLHGPPGTGKTTVLRALARAWRPWCRTDAVIDPEQLLGDASYLLTPALRDPGDDESRWCLLILEDCDELIRADAKQGTGQSLARLLNATDGLLGQGVELIVALTTNEPVGRLHPAVIRPGRCLAEVEVGALTPAEAAAWLGRPLPRSAAAGATLAELYARRDHLDVIEESPLAAVTGQYL